MSKALQLFLILAVFLAISVAQETGGDLDHDHDHETPETDHDHQEEFTRMASVGEAIGAAFCVAIASFIGVILLVPSFAWVASHFDILNAIDAFASGAILAVVLFIIIPESLGNLAVQYPEESQTSAWFGSLMLGGFITPIVADWVVGLLFPEQRHQHGAKATKTAAGEDPAELGEAGGPSHGTDDPETGDFFLPVPPTTPSNDDVSALPEHATADHASPVDEDKERHRTPSVVRGFFNCCPMSGVVWSITIGDGLHNFTDGVLIGIGFKFCGSSLGWAIAGASVIHELAAELSEFWLLINPDAGGLSWLQAAVLNFLTSLTVVIGCLIVSYVDITAFTLGLLLAFGGGLLMYLGIVGVWGRLMERTPTLGFVFTMFFSFAFGAVAIGLVLLSHTHCHVETTSSTETHADHAH